MASGAFAKTIAVQILTAAYGLAALQLGGRQMRIAICGAKKYERARLDEMDAGRGCELVYIEASLGSGTASLAAGFPAVAVFVPTTITRERRHEAACRCFRSGYTEYVSKSVAPYIGLAAAALVDSFHQDSTFVAVAKD